MKTDNKFDRGVLFGLAGLVILLLVNAGLSYQNLHVLRESGRQVAHTHTVLETLADIRAAVNRTVLWQRTFLITGNEAQHAAMDGALDEARQRLGRLGPLTADDPSRMVLLSGLETRLADLEASLRNTITMRKDQGFEAAREIVRDGGSIRRFDGVRGFIIAMEEDEERLLDQRLQRAEQAYTAAVVTGLVATLMGVLAIAMLAWLQRRHFAVRSRAAQDRQRAEDELRESARRERLRADELETVMAAVPAVVWIAHDPACRRITGNAASHRLLRLPPAANQSLSAPAQEQPAGFRVMKDGVELRRDQLPVQLAARGIEVCDFEEEIVFYDGTRIHLFGHAMPLRDEAGEPRGAVAAFVDISDRKRVEAQIRESETHFRSMADNVPAILWVTDPSGACIYLSQQWYEFTGRPPGSDVGFGWLDAVHPEDAATAGAVFRDANARRIPFTLDYRLRRKDGEYRWSVDAGLPRFVGAAFQGYVGCVFDVHDRKLAEVENARLLDDLKRSDRRKDEFLATLAHELRNPLAPIRNGLQIIKLARGDGAIVESARDMMERQLGQLVRLVDDLMDVSRITQGRLDLRREPMPVSAVLQSALEANRPLMEAMGHTLTLAVPDEPIMVDADLTRLAQVFTNLLNNAVKYSERGGHIRVRVERHGNEVSVAVKDSGIGIAGDQLPRIFDMFAQTDGSLAKSQGGLGIGLTLVKRLVEMHGGRIEARSAGPGCGAEFIVRLPIAASPALPEAAAPPAAPPSALRILIVDDNRDVADSLAAMLSIMGNDTRTAYDGLAGVELAERYRPDVALFDIGLPTLDGYEACRRIRAQPWGERLVLIAVTGWGQDADRRRSQEAGFAHHMVKPVDPQALIDVLNALVHSNDA